MVKVFVWEAVEVVTTPLTMVVAVTATVVKTVCAEAKPTSKAIPVSRGTVKTVAPSMTAKE